MAKGKEAVRYFFVGIWALVMTALTYVLGAVSLKLLRRKLGRLNYWLIGSAVCLGLLAAQLHLFAAAFFSLIVLIGVFSELEDWDLSFMVSFFFTLVINSMLCAGAFALWVYSTGPKWNQIVLDHVKKAFQPLMEINSTLQIQLEELMLQLPSILLILWMVAIYLSVILEGRFSGSKYRSQLSDFKVPDSVIWIFIVSLLGAFGDFSIPAVHTLSVNALNVTFVLFFFQGMAVLGKLFVNLRMGTFWQTVFTLFIVLYLFLLVGLLGLVDHWLDIRSRLEKRAERFKREI